MGIKDLHCKVEANTKNYQAIVRAFFDALVHQVTNFLPSLVLKTVYFGSVEHSPEICLLHEGVHIMLWVLCGL